MHIHLPPSIFFIPIVPPVYNTNTLDSRKHFVPLTSIIATTHHVVYMYISFPWLPLPRLLPRRTLTCHVSSRVVCFHNPWAIYLNVDFFYFSYHSQCIPLDSKLTIVLISFSLKEKCTYSRKIKPFEASTPWTCPWTCVLVSSLMWAGWGCDGGVGAWQTGSYRNTVIKMLKDAYRYWNATKLLKLPKLQKVAT